MTKVMVVDDNPRMIEYMAQLLEPYSDYKVSYSATTIDAARDVLTKESPALTFLDIQLPDGNGLSLMPFIKQYHPGMYVVILTAFYDDFNGEAYSHGEDDYLLKPVDPSELDKVIRRYQATHKEEKRDATVMQRGKLNGMLALVNANGELCLRSCDDIAFFRYDGKRKMWIAVLDNSVIFTLHKGTSAKDILLLSPFYQQSHQSFIVNLKYVDTIGNTFVRLRKPFHLYAIPMSRTFQHAFTDRLQLM